MKLKKEIFFFCNDFSQKQHCPKPKKNDDDLK